MRKVRWGILGAATIARKNWQAIRNTGNSVVVAVASREIERARQFIASCQCDAPMETPARAFDSYDAVIRDSTIDAVYIPLPTGLRKEWVIRAAAAGKHVLCEKPCATTAADLKEMIEACARNKVQFMDGNGKRAAKARFSLRMSERYFPHAPSARGEEGGSTNLVDILLSKLMILRMTPKLADSRFRVGFTLLELFLSIAIIGLLTSLLLPAVASAKSGAHLATCINNQRQLVAAMSMYATDNNDSVPHPNWDFNPSYAGWLCRPPFDKPATNIQTGLLWKYSPTVQTYMCPQDKTNTASYQARRQKYTSYIMNGAACMFQTQARPRTVKISTTRKDAIILWQADERNFRDFNDGASKPDEGITRMHSDGGIVGVIDGTVEHLKARQFNQEILKKPGRLWWNPQRKDGSG